MAWGLVKMITGLWFRVWELRNAYGVGFWVNAGVVRSGV